MLTFIIICLALGSVAGFLAGLFGIGGGMVIVPVLAYSLPMIGMPHDLIMASALGTSFATIVITGFSAAQRHHKLGNVDWRAVKYLAPSLVIAVFIAGLFIGKLPKEISSKIFACLVIYLAAKMIWSIKPKATADKPLTATSAIVGGGIIGVIASAAGIGGGGFIVPFLNARGVEIKKAIGSSSLCGMFLGLSGMLSFVVGGWNNTTMPSYSLGYVYLPAVLCIVATSFFTSKLGANTANKLPVATLKRYFAIFLVVIAIDMIFN